MSLIQTGGRGTLTSTLIKKKKMLKNMTLSCVDYSSCVIYLFIYLNIVSTMLK